MNYQRLHKKPANELRVFYMADVTKGQDVRGYEPHGNAHYRFQLVRLHQITYSMRIG
jgi:hypothetical protein